MNKPLRILITLEFGASVEITVKSYQEGLQYIEGLAKDGITVKSYEFLNLSAPVFPKQDGDKMRQQTKWAYELQEDLFSTETLEELGLAEMFGSSIKGPVYH